MTAAVTTRRDAEVLVAADPVRAHVARLRADGLGLRQIAGLSGVSIGSLTRLVHGDRRRGHAPSTRVHRSTAAAVLAVRPRLANLGSRVGVDGTGTRRRLQALVWCGWTQVRLAGELGLTQQRLNQLLAQDRVGAQTALAVRELYERLWDTPPPAASRWERGAVKRMRVLATGRGWVPPLGWDDDTIDDPAAHPQHAVEVPDPAGPNRKIRFEDVEFLLDSGMTNLEALATRLGSTPATMERYVGVVRAGKQATWRQGRSDVA